MGRFARKWPQELRDSIANAVAAGDLKTEDIFTQIKAGTLRGLSKPYPDFPRRTFFGYLADARSNQRRRNAPGEPPLLPKLIRELERDEQRVRELEAEGHAPAEIAHVAGLSQRTVDLCLSADRRRVGADTSRND